MNKPTPKKNERGAAAVEFALILPLLMLLIFGGIEFGLVMFNKQILTNASREAARAGIVVIDEDPDGNRLRVLDSEINSVVSNYCASHLVTFDPDGLPPEVVVEHLDGQKFGDNLTVTVRYAYEFLLVPNLRSLFGASVSNDLTIAATTIMRYE